MLRKIKPHVILLLEGSGKMTFMIYVFLVAQTAKYTEMDSMEMVIWIMLGFAVWIHRIVWQAKIHMLKS